MIRIVCAFAVCLVLVGCGVGTRQHYPRTYVLSGAAAAASEVARAPAVPASLALTRVRVPAWLQGTGLVYRLAYRHDDSIGVYADSRWVAPPAEMLERILRTTLAGEGGWRTVLGPAGFAHADFNLQIQLDDFSQNFASPGHSEAVLDAFATLVDSRSGEVVAQRRFTIRAAAGADAASGVRALNQASQKFAERVRAWSTRLARLDKAPNQG